MFVKYYSVRDTTKPLYRLFLFFEREVGPRICGTPVKLIHLSVCLKFLMVHQIRLIPSLCIRSQEHFFVSNIINP